MERIEVKKLCLKIIDLLDKNYVISSTKDKVIEGINNKLINGVYDSLTNYDDFVTTLTEDLVKFTGDKHLYVRKIEDNNSNQDNYNWQQKEKDDEIKHNYGFTEVRILEGNVGYIKIIEFMNPDRGIGTAIAAMKFIENTNATIIDIKDNGGGYGGLAEYLISYFFSEEPTLLSTTYINIEDKVKTYQTFTHPFVLGKRRENHKLFILINNKTASAAEYFAYTLQSNNKAIVLGEISAGGANRNTFFHLNDKLRISISTGYPSVESTGTNWEGTGVIPNIACSSAEALNVAMDEILEEICFQNC